MIRVEIIANRSVEENILEALAKEGVRNFTQRFPMCWESATAVREWETPYGLKKISLL